MPAAMIDAAMLLIRSHHQQAELCCGWISQRLHLTPVHLDAAFQQCRGRSCDAAIQSYRLSRLFDRINHSPALPLTQQVEACGFRTLDEADVLFQHEFGIQLQLFHAVSQRAAEDRHFRQEHPCRRSLIINE